MSSPIAIPDAPTALGHAAGPVPTYGIPQPVIPLQHPEPPPAQDILRYYEASTRAAFYSNGGPCVTLLASRLCEYLGAGTHCIPVANCTVGLVAAIRAACGRRKGHVRRVICPSYTFTATACAIVWGGFEPVFVDVEPDGWHMDPHALERTLERYAGSVAGVLACATFGTAPTADQRAAWRATCESHGVPLLIDAAPGFGTTDEHGLRIGGLGDTEIFSFHATKPFAVGEGGLVTTRDGDLAERLLQTINFGLEAATRASVEIGINGKMSELHGAAALAMLDRIDDVVRRRRANAARLRATLAELPFTFQRGAETSTWQIFHLLAPSAAVRARVIELARERAVEVRTMHAPALHQQPAFAATEHGDLAVTESLATRALALPMANQLPEQAFTRIPELLEAALT